MGCSEEERPLDVVDARETGSTYGVGVKGQSERSGTPSELDVMDALAALCLTPTDRGAVLGRDWPGAQLLQGSEALRPA